MSAKTLPLTMTEIPAPGPPPASIPMPGVNGTTVRPIVGGGARGRAMGRGEEFTWSEGLRLENEHPDMPNPSRTRARAASSKQSGAAGAPRTPADSEIAFEVLDEALANSTTTGSRTDGVPHRS